MRLLSPILILLVCAAVVRCQSDRFTFSPEDAKQQKQSLDDAQEEEALVVFETILEDGKEAPKDEAIIVKTDDVDDSDSDDNSDDDVGNDSTTKKDDDDDDLEEDEIDEEVSSDPPKTVTKSSKIKLNKSNARGDNGDDIDDEEDEIEEDVSSDSKTVTKLNSNQIRRQGDIYPGYKKDDETSRQQVYDSDSSPLLRLTQGGYHRPQYDSIQRPYDRQYDNIQTQQTAERPTTGELPRRQPQAAYNQQPQPNPMFFHHPFENSGSEGFFAGRPSPFTPPSNIPFRNEFQGVSMREQNPFAPQYQVPTMDLLFQQGPPQFVQPQQMVVDPRQRPVPSMFQPQMSYPTSYAGNSADSASVRPSDYSAYFRNSQPPHFHQGSFYNVLPPNAGAYQNLPNASPVQSSFARYPSPVEESRNIHKPVVEESRKFQNPAEDSKREQNSEETVSDVKKPVAVDQISAEPDKEDPISVPFGTRIQHQPFAIPRDVYIRYPMKEAGYATEDNLPAQNTTEDSATRQNSSPFPFLSSGRTYPGFSNPDPYRNALNSLTSNQEDNSSRPAEGFSRNAAFTRETVPVMRRYPIGGPSFYDPNPAAFPFTLPDRVAPQPAPGATPACAKDANATLCFKDPEYPRRELLYALNSDSYMLDRMVMSDQPRLDAIPLVSDQLNSSNENYVCKAEVTYGTPLRAKNARGTWKVVVNIEGAIGGGKFIQPVRIEECRGGSGSPCSLSTDLRTRCVQKYSLQRLLSWSPEKGLHNDVYRMPVACSCQLL